MGARCTFVLKHSDDQAVALYSHWGEDSMNQDIAGGGITYQLASDLTTWNPVGSGIDPDDVMLKSVYDTTDSGVVDDSQRLDNQLPA